MLLDGQNTSHSTQASAKPAQYDVEFSGLLNRASSQGAKFALLLSMLQQNYLERPAVALREQHSRVDNLAILSRYPKIPLSVQSRDWRKGDIASSIINNDGIASAHLWLAMHPQPLSLHNDVSHIDASIMANCDIYTQQRYSNDVELEREIEVDVTSIYDLLQHIGLDMQNVA
ncbi:MAG: hypothetical protein ACI8R9_002432 [Paraglaciecola sp.]|jgi:hypothetical protein